MDVFYLEAIVKIEKVKSSLLLYMDMSERKSEKLFSGLRLGPERRRAILLVLLVVLAVAILREVGAVTWSDDKIRLTTLTYFDGIPSIVQMNNGEVWILWSQKKANYDICYIASSDQGLTWSEETQLTTDSGANVGVSACQALDGTVWLFWASDRAGNFDIYYKTSLNLGSSWSNDTQLTTYSGQDLKPSVRQLSNGTIFVVWSSDRTGGYDIYLKTSSDGGVSWSDPICLTNSSVLDKSPSIAQMSDGTVWLFWSSDGIGHYDIYYKHYNGFYWSSPESLTSDTKVDSNPFVFQTFDGKIWVFWSSREPSEAGTDDVYYKYSSDNGVTWSGKIQFTTDTYDDIWPSAVQTDDLRIWVVWTSDRADQPDWGNWDIYYNTSLVGDVNEDGVVDIIDLSLVGIAFGCFEGEPNYNPDADISSDGIVDVLDISYVCLNYGAT